MSELLNEARRRAAVAMSEKKKKEKEAVDKSLEIEAAKRKNFEKVERMSVELISLLKPLFEELEDSGFYNINTSFGERTSEYRDDIGTTGFYNYHSLIIEMSHETDNPPDFIHKFEVRISFNNEEHVRRNRKREEYYIEGIGFFKNLKDIVGILRKKSLDILIKKEESKLES